MKNLDEMELERLEALNTKEKEQLEETRQKVEKLMDQADIHAKKILRQAQHDADKIQERLDKTEERLHEREDRLDKKKESLKELEDKLHTEQEKVQALIKQQAEKLSQIANLTPEEAKEELMNIIKETNEKEIATFLEKYRLIKSEEADKEAMEIIARVMPRLAADNVGEFTSEFVDIPDENYKWKLIGREWRNIHFFEKTTGVEMIIDDTPGVVRISCYDHDVRFIGSTTLKKLIKDWRINPYYIEKFYNETLEEFDNLVLEKWKEALSLLNIPMMNPDLVQYIGKFYMRYSYGQNLRNHSIEVAKIAEWIASEMGEDPLLAKKAGLLHDIGKVIAENGESHTAVWADALRKFGLHERIINTAESHHFETPMTNLISWIVTAADGISASRPGARMDTRDFFVEKMGELETLIMSLWGIQKVHIMQAGREIMVYVNPEQIKDSELQSLVQTIWEKIESQLDYPGIIRISLMRESKIVDFLR